MTSKVNNNIKIKSKTHSQESIPSFIRKTYDILEECKFPDVINWNPEGTALVIKKPTEFCQKVLPAYFKHNNLTSFVRQLNMYNFHKRRTQNIDHVYYHELFQRGKRNLLKEIKRKNYEHATEKVQKVPEGFEAFQPGKDLASMASENHFLKRLYTDAMNKLAMLEGQVKELSMQNNSLWSQICKPTSNDNQKELTRDQLPMTFGEVIIPPLKMTAEREPSMPNAVSFAKMPSIWSNVNCFLNLGEDSGDSTDVSHNSPSLQPSMESETCFDMSEATPIYSEICEPIQLPEVNLTSQVSQFFNPTNELMMSKREMSVGQLFEAWNFENENIDMTNFSDQKFEKSQDRTVLGKRQFEAGSQDFHFPEPVMKRQELSIYSRKFNDELDINMGVDMMDFNQPLLGWTA